ncbi:CPBP family intramembrane glutamic endopeptidase [Apilactobacillus xinyiensis]|uniref:CPBP family intramembrane glutamic endopeptidase n=1 Tax=Apilactobacillus xinyiensis TaxID=2841032 RepID=UPI00200FF23D|nr:CPBP family intramembrane glutamic endopeptidase [Apilactobacillus xinyiensis]MCL0330230.1 CPBP family intramembrane metalloprotease [Apilactobacillus xinyiensis]
MDNKRLSGSERLRNILVFFGMFCLVAEGFQFIPLVFIKKNSNVVNNIIAIFFYFAMYGILIWLALTCYQKYGRHSIKQRFSGYEFKTAVVFVGISLIIEFILSFMNITIYNQNISNNQKSIDSIMGQNTVTLILMLFGAIILSPILEELVFRGILMDTVFQPTAKWLPIIVSGGLFSLGHSPGFNIFFILTYFEMGFFMAYVYQKTGNIKANIAMHMMNNFIASIGTIITIIQK